MSPTLYSEEAEQLAQSFLETRPADGSSSLSLQSQMEHRKMLARHWNITPGSRVLEIGCGQGDCTIILADAVGKNGHVDAIDPGAPDYGSPWTLSEAQSHISSTALGPRIQFHHADAPSYLSTYTGPSYDSIVLCHSLWYFASPSILTTIITSILQNPKTKSAILCMAEWSLRASTPESQPHVITALLLCAMEARRNSEGHGNIRTVMSPEQICGVVRSTGGFTLLNQTIEKTNEGMQDGFWEVSDTLRSRGGVLEEMRSHGVDEKGIAAMIAMYDSLKSSVDLLDGGVKGVKSMDVWIAKFAAS